MVWISREAKHPIQDPKPVQQFVLSNYRVPVEEPNQQVANQHATNQQVTFKQRFKAWLKSNYDLKKFKSDLESTPGLTRRYVIIHAMLFIFSIMLQDDAFTEKRNMSITYSVNHSDSTDRIVSMDKIHSTDRIHSKNDTSITEMWKWDVFIPYTVLLAAIIATAVAQCYNQYQSRRWFVFQMILYLIKISSAIFITAKTFSLTWEWFILYANYFALHVAIILDGACTHYFVQGEESSGIEISKRTIFSVIWCPVWFLFCLVLFYR